MLDNTISEKFMPESNRKLYFVSDDANKIIDYLENYKSEDTDITEFKNISK